MKSFHLQSLFVAAIALTFSACEKSAENLENLSEKKAASISGVVYPLIGTDISNNILPRRKLPKAVLSKGWLYPEIKVQLIDTVCAEYLNGTKKFDLSSIKDGSVTYVIKSADNTLIGDPDFFNDGFLKLSTGSAGWWTHWNYSPYTEAEFPDVLFAVNRRAASHYPVNSISISLNSSVKTFGFEIAPNTTGEDIEVIATYNDLGTYRAPELFYVEQTISSPSGARLIAVKSEEPFSYINIEIKEDDPYPGNGFAIANLRYELVN
jgi:hypothetical protein